MGKMLRAGTVLLVATLGVTACSQKPKLECSNKEAQSVTVDLIKDQIEKSVTEQLKSGNTQSHVLSSNIRATVQQLVISLLDIRTTKEDPNSTKRFCTARVHIAIPSDVIDNAEKARSDAKLTDISSLADESKVDRQANAFNVEFDYDVQPTDSGDKVFAESDDFSKISSFYGELLASSLLKSAIEQAQTAQQEAAAAQQQQQQAALAEQHAADLAQAKTDNQLANQTLTALWKNLAPDVRSSILEDQRAWIRKKIADCNVEAAASSTDAGDQEITRLRCDSKATQARIQRFQQGSGQSAPF